MPRYKVVSPNDVAALLGFERMKEMAGCDDLSCAADIAGALGTRFILQGTLDALGSSLIITATLIDSQKVEVVARTDLKVRNVEDEYYEAIHQLVGKLFGEELQLGEAAPSKAAGADTTASPEVARAVACLEKGDTEACRLLVQAKKSPFGVLGEDCTKGAKESCDRLVAHSHDDAGTALYDACNAGAVYGCQRLVETERIYEHTSLLRTLGFWFTGAGAALTVTATALWSYWVASGEEPWAGYSGLAATLAATASLAVGISLLSIGYYRVNKVKASVSPYIGISPGGAQGAFHGAQLNLRY